MRRTSGLGHVVKAGIIEPADLIVPGQAKRLAEARTASGHTAGELAELLGISYEAYRDLEWFDEEIVDTISFDQLIKLADALSFDVRSFFDATTLPHVPFDELATRLTGLLVDGGDTVATLEERAGWEFSRHLHAPVTFGELPAIALADIGACVGLDWRCFLPKTSHAPQN